MNGEPRAVICGTGRHGSGYIARVLCAAGVPCGHEQWWNPHHARVPGLAVDSSWCAAPFLQWAPSTVWHQTRHPLDVVSSLVKLPNWGQYLTLAETVTGPLPGEVVHAAARTVLRLNEACEAEADRRWQVEHVDAELVEQLAAYLQIDVDAATARQAVESVPRDTNYHGHGARLTWDDVAAVVPRGEFDALLAMALRYGYER